MGKYLLEHFRSQTPGLGVVATAVIGIKQLDAFIQPMQTIVSELKLFLP